MIKKSLYPKTKRKGNDKTVITEKLDGSNIGFFKLDGKLIIATRNRVFDKEEALNGDALYKKLKDWLIEYADVLENDLYEGSGVFGEWIAMGKLKYDFDKPLHLFAKARIDKELTVTNINYKIEHIGYAFSKGVVPEYIDIVNVVAEMTHDISIAGLDELYNNYLNEVGRPVEGFIINNNNTIRKYVRNKGSKLQAHKI